MIKYFNGPNKYPVSESDLTKEVDRLSRLPSLNADPYVDFDGRAEEAEEFDAYTTGRYRKNDQGKFEQVPFEQEPLCTSDHSWEDYTASKYDEHTNRMHIASKYEQNVCLSRHRQRAISWLPPVTCGEAGCTYCDSANYDLWDVEDVATKQVTADAERHIDLLREREKQLKTLCGQTVFTVMPKADC